MARPVLSGTCPVKPLFGLGHRAAAQFQGLGNLLIASLCRATILFFRSSESSLPRGAMLKFQWPVWKSESDNTKFNTPAPHSHLRPYNTNESHDTGERKWLIGPNLSFLQCCHMNRSVLTSVRYCTYKLLLITLYACTNLQMMSFWLGM